MENEVLIDHLGFVVPTHAVIRVSAGRHVPRVGSAFASGHYRKDVPELL